MVTYRTVSRKQEKRAARKEVEQQSRPQRETRIHIEEKLPEAPSPPSEPVPVGPKSVFEELGGAHGLICMGQMLFGAHLLTLVLTMTMHCAPYEDVWYASIGLLGCIGGFATGDKENGLSLNIIGRIAMWVQLALIGYSSIATSDRTCLCGMPYSVGDRLLYTCIKHYTSIFAIFAALFHLVFPRLEPKATV